MLRCYSVSHAAPYPRSCCKSAVLHTIRNTPVPRPMRDVTRSLAIRGILNAREPREKIAATSSENTLTLPRCECGTELDESQLFEYGGAVACEKCVTDYEKKKLRALCRDSWTGDRAAATVTREVQTRRDNAIEWLKRNRKSLEKQAAKRGARWNPHQQSIGCTRIIRTTKPSGMCAVAVISK